MKWLPNVIALVLVPGLLAVVLYVGPTAIVAYGWRLDQLAIQQGMSTAIQLKALQQRYTDRAIRAFNYSTYNSKEIRGFLEDYMTQARPLYAQFVDSGRFFEIDSTTDIKYTYPNVLALVVSYTLTTGYTNIQINDAFGQSMLALFAYSGTILCAIIIASMCQTYAQVLRFIFANMLRLDESSTNPDRVSYKYMWAVAKRDALVMFASLILLVLVIVAGTVLMIHDQDDWSWTMGLIYIQAAAFASGHTKYVPDPIESNQASVLYVVFMLALHVWLMSFVALVFSSMIALAKSVYTTQWAEITDVQLEHLQARIELRKQRRQLDNPKYEQ